MNCSVLIASPSAAVRSRWKQAIGGMCAVYQVIKRAELERKMVKLKPSVLFADLALPRIEGIRDIIAIQHLSSTTKIVVLTSVPNQYEEILALEAGARGYCNTDIDSVLIKRAVQVVQKGEIWAERSIVARLLKELIARTYDREMISRSQKKEQHATHQATLDTLTAREREIVMLIGRASSNKEIADLLQISESTVKAHLGSIFRKLGVSDRLGLALFISARSRASAEAS